MQHLRIGHALAKSPVTFREMRTAPTGPQESVILALQFAAVKMFLHDFSFVLLSASHVGWRGRKTSESLFLGAAFSLMAMAISVGIVHR